MSRRPAGARRRGSLPAPRGSPTRLESRPRGRPPAATPAFITTAGRTGRAMLIVPMVNVGGPGVYADESDGWSVYSDDGSMAAHFEFTVAATKDGPRILTPWDKV